MKKVTTLFLFLAICFAVSAKDVLKTTCVYDVKDNDTLCLDKYEVKTTNTKKPCILFVFGGGFVGGNRNQPAYYEYFNTLAKSGYVVVSIDYRLGLLPTAMDFKNGKKVGAKEMVRRLQKAIDIAVTDLYDATNYVIENADNWGVDTSEIVVSGSSAGAITALQSEYYLHSDKYNLDKVLPENFDYAGVISFAGAIFSTKGGLKWSSNPAPIQFFHGDADKNVPYSKKKILKIGFYGSKNLSEQLSKMKSPYQFFDFNNRDHSIAVTPMKENLQDIETFLKEWVINKKPKTEHVLIKDLTLPELPKKFGIKDYIKANFAH